MSMNLAVSCDGIDLKLWQTPTYITRMCLMTENGYRSRVKGNNAMRAVFCYLQWVSNYGIELNDLKKEHANQVLNAVKKCSKLIAYEV